MIGNFLGYFEKPHSHVKTALGYILCNFWKKLPYFLLQHLVTLYEVKKISLVVYV